MASANDRSKDPDRSNNSSNSVTTVPRPIADLSITVSDEPDPAQKGELLTYTIEVINKGPDEATGVEVVDELPENVIFHSMGTTRGRCSRTGRLNQAIMSMAPTPSGKGYWLVASDGGIFSFGDAGFHGSTGSVALNKPIMSMAATPSGKGYWLVASDGGVFSFGDAAFHGSTGSVALNKPIMSMAATPSGNGYWMVASDGGVFAFGDAAFHGSTGEVKLNKPIMSMAPTPSGKGYWLVASDGGIFSFGDAGFHGSTGSVALNKPITGMARTPAGNGYWMVASDGGVFAFQADFLGAAATHDTVTCRLGSLDFEGEATVTINVIPTESGIIRNRASVRSTDFDPDERNNVVDSSDSASSEPAPAEGSTSGEE